jgi:uncharacterized membrane protein YbhN (UPF0104 family)
MNSLKKLIGGFAVVVGVALAYLLVSQALTELGASTATTETRVFWGVILPIALLILAGLVLFGYYAARGEYSPQPPKGANKR